MRLRARACASLPPTRRCFHWPLEFPEVFLDSTGRAAPDGGFDAVDRQSAVGDAARRSRARCGGRRGSVLARGGHLPRAVARPRESVPALRRASVEPAASWRPARPARAGRLSHAITAPPTSEPSCFDVTDSNRCSSSTTGSAIFPIHRGVRFAAMTAVAQRPLSYVACRFGLDTTDRLDTRLARIDATTSRSR